MKFKTRIRLISFLVAFVVVLISSFVFLLYIPESLYRNAIQASQSINKQTLFVFDSLMESLGTMSQIPFIDADIISVLNKDYTQYPQDTRKLHIYRDIDLVNARLYTHMFYNNRYVDAVMLHSFKSDIVYSKYKAMKSPDIEVVREQDWYKRVYSSDGEVVYFPIMPDAIYGSKEQVISIGRLIKAPRTNEDLGIMRIDVFADNLHSLWKSTYDIQAHFILLNQQGELIYSSFSLDKAAELQQVVSTESLDREVVYDGEKYILCRTESDLFGYGIYTIIPYRIVYKDVYDTMAYIIAISICVTILVFIVSELLSRRAMQPIQELNELMKKVQKGDLSVQSHQIDKGDFGEVCQSFNLMVSNTKDLIDRIHTEEQERAKAEYQALQAQISPHFIMNTINSIKWMAFIQGNQSIESCLTALAGIISFAIRNREDHIQIQTEVRQIDYYMQILSIRYPNRFDIHMDVRPETLDCITLKYILQPIVENSVFHGFAGQAGNGRIEIRIFLDDSKVVYEVQDNGKGIDAETIAQILSGQTENSHSSVNKIGIFNVHKRIQMAFGLDYGVTIRSGHDEGTLVRITIPQIREEASND